MDISSSSTHNEVHKAYDDIIELKEWRAYLTRYGPIKQCYAKMHNFCFSDGKKAAWFKPNYTLQHCDEYLQSVVNHHIIDSTHCKFIVRLAANPPIQAFELIT